MDVGFDLVPDLPDRFDRLILRIRDIPGKGLLGSVSRANISAAHSNDQVKDPFWQILESFGSTPPAPGEQEADTPVKSMSIQIL